MCGIGGVIGLPLEEALPIAHRLRAALRHRGPDGEGIEIIAHPAGTEPPVVFVHTRLAILDLTSAGRQPMAHRQKEREPIWITFNGEIYNYRTLILQARHEGLLPETATDTEAILLSYRLWGKQWVERLRGMFAFALADPAQRQIWLARDRLGIKPLYIFQPSCGGLLFASEVRALLAAGTAVVPPRLSPSATESFLAQGAVYGDAAHIHGIQLLEPGTVWRCDWSGRIQQKRRYWSLQTVVSNTYTGQRPAAVAKVAYVLQETVQQHLVADVPVGVFLSSGVDSTAIAALATKSSAAKIRTITVGFDQPEFDETTAAARIAHELGTDHHTIRLHAADIWQNFERVLSAMDQPTVDGFNTYYVSKAAKEVGVTVALSGLGGDELFGGYATFRDVPWAVRLHRWLKPWKSASACLRWLGRRMGRRSLVKLAELPLRPPSISSLYLLRRELFLPAERRALRPLPENCDPLTGLPHADWSLPRGLDLENSVSYLELTGYLRHMLLRDADVFSMAHALELRVPLLDSEVVATVSACPGKWKRAGRIPKPLLTDALRDSLPSWVTRLPKRGFTFPWSQWLRGPLAPLAEQRLLQTGLWKRIGFDHVAVADQWQRFRSGDPTVGGLQVLALLILADIVERQRLSLA